MSWNHMGLPCAWTQNSQLLSFPCGSYCIFHTFALFPTQLFNKAGDITALFPHPAICRGDQEEKTFSHRRSAFESDRSCLKSLLCALQGVGTTLWKTGIMGPQRIVVSIPRRWAFTVTVRPLSSWVAK